MRYFCFVALFLFFFINGCSWFEKTPDVSHIEVDFELIPFYEDLLAIPPDSTEAHIERLKKKYGAYLQAYSEGIIKTGHPSDEAFAENLSKFIAYEPNQEVFDTCKKVFSDKEALKNEISQAFRYYRYYYPKRTIPDVYLHISGFNQSIVVDSCWVSVSVEKYLGSDCIFYQWLEIPNYLRQQMRKENVVPDIIKAIGMTEYTYNDSLNDLISQIIYHGKILHFVEHMIPDIPDTILFGYSEKEMTWCQKNESFMWRSIVEQKHFFSTDYMLIQKYIGKAPFTSFFGQDSPGRTGRYLGYQLMEAWRKNNSDQSFRDMMQAADPHRILAKSGYRP